MAFTLETQQKRGTLCFPLDDDSLKEDDGEGASQVELGIPTCAERVHSWRGEKYSDREHRNHVSFKWMEHLHAREENVFFKCKEHFFLSSYV